MGSMMTVITLTAKDSKKLYIVLMKVLLENMVSHFNSHLFDEIRTSRQLLYPRFGPKTCSVTKESNLAEGRQKLTG